MTNLDDQSRLPKPWREGPSQTRRHRRSHPIEVKTEAGSGPTVGGVLEFLAAPVRAVFGATGHDLGETLHETRDIEAHMLGAVDAIEGATASIERHVEVIETLATSVDPLRASVDRLTDTMQELVAMLAPMAAAEHEMQRAGRFFGRHRHDEPPEPPPPAKA